MAEAGAAARAALAVVIESADGDPVDVDELRKWIGRSESYRDRVAPTPVAALAATLDRDDPPPVAGDPLPPLWHWLYFLPLHRASQLGPDGHARRGGFLPPVPLSHRMFAGGRFRFDHPLRVGDDITRESRVIDVTHKTGRTGPLIFVVVRHEISDPRGCAIVEEHDLVYRGQTMSGAAARAVTLAPVDAEWREEVEVDDVLLFRYSALTFNGHRIHYDRRYATEVEGYPGLVVHGPLIATLLLELLRGHMAGAGVAEFAFRAVSPIFDLTPFITYGRRDADRRVRLWAAGADGALAMDASAVLR
jgi:3-methylfumaryl-CoA hydratase